MRRFRSLFEDKTPAGMMGRTGTKDAEDHITDELKTRFKKVVSELGGKTVAMHLLGSMASRKPMMSEAKDISKKVIKLLKTGSVVVQDPDGLHIAIDEYDDGYFYGIDQFDNDVEISSLKGYIIVD